MREQYLTLAESAGKIAADRGDAAQALSKAAKTLEATFTVPYLAHAPMEPLVCVVQLKDDACEIWAGSQLQTLDQAIAAKIAGLAPEQVTIHTLLAGGSFGRHANPTVDYIAEAVATAKATRELNAPIRLMWTREDDIKGGYYRPLFAHRLAAGLDAQGKPTAWLHATHRRSIHSGRHAVRRDDEGQDRLHLGRRRIQLVLRDSQSARGAAHHPERYPVWWRSVGHTHTAFATEVFIDELAAAGQDL